MKNLFSNAQVNISEKIDRLSSTVHLNASLENPVKADAYLSDADYDEPENGDLTGLLRIINRASVILVLAICFLVAAFALSMFFLFRSSLKQESFTHEMGTYVSEKPEDYIVAGELAMHFAQVDLSGIDLYTPGEYKVVIKCPGNKLTAPFIIEDTNPPQITVHNSELTFVQGTKLSPSDLIWNIKDADYQVQVTFEEGLNDPEDLECRYLGKASAWIRAVDSSGNKSRVCVSYIVDNPPYFTKLKDFYVAEGEDIDLLKYVSAYDDTDGDLTGKISMYPLVTDFREGDSFELTFRVEDSYHLKTTEKVNVYVKSASELQRLIGRRSVTRENAIIVGAINEYDTGLFSNRSIEQTMIDVMPTVVDIQVAEKNGSTTTGSGFIAQIDGKDIYIITNRHVVNANPYCDVFFYTSDSASAEVVGFSDNYDVAMIKVSLDDLPDNFSDIISTVHIDMNYWDKIEDDSRVELGLEKMAPDGTIEHYTYGLLVKKMQDFEFFAPHLQTEMDLRLQLGDSGSAVFDKHGRLICMAFAYSVAPERDWAIPLPEIVSAYEEITGKPLYVY